ncbi:MAG TPA: winged helix-turn-helix domain-containing protein [Anaerolineales bacterium]|nr:winged helix-turn-helix domain-containing protein [Anaerolineales bacterium]
MPTPEPDILIAPTATTFSFSLEPAQNAIHSLFLLTMEDKLSGLDDWVARTLASLPPELERRHKVVILGLYYAVVPQRSYASFSAYLDDLGRQDPVLLRDRVMDAYYEMQWKDRSIEQPPQEQVLASTDAFIRFLLDRFPADHIDIEVEIEAFAYLNDPPAMKSLILSHLQEMWDTYLEAEWKRVLPMLQESIAAFRQVDMSGLSNPEAIHKVTGQELGEWCDESIEQAERIIFVPSAHLGPYLGRKKSNGTLWLLFGARLPEGVQAISPDLSRAEILVRLAALADDTRLRILKLISENQELSSKDVMARLELSQSAASRHLTQLTATGYLEERRCEGAKCYTLNPERLENTLHAVAAYLGMNE